jgi:hypothetical protein
MHADAQISQHQALKAIECWKERADTEAGVLSGISQKHNMRSRFYRFTEFCNSQCLSHFAAPFIVVRTETSIAENCKTNESIIRDCKNLDRAPTARLDRHVCHPNLLLPSSFCPAAPGCNLCTEPHSVNSHEFEWIVRMILPQVHLRKPCYDFSFL